MTNTQSQDQYLEAIPSDRVWLRSEIMGTQVITRDTGRRLGVVGEVVVDIDHREVIAFGLRDNPLTRFLPGLPRWMPLDRIRQVGDVILVDSLDSLSEGFSPERYSSVINCEVITESGQQLGRVLGFSFDIETGELTTLVMGALGVPLLGEGVLSTWEIPVEEIVSTGADRIIVYEGAEDKLKQLNSGFLEKLGVGGSTWEEQERERYRVNLVPVENQLTAGENINEVKGILEASNAEQMQQEEELEYVELEQKNQSFINQQRYLDQDNEREFASFTNNQETKDSLEKNPLNQSFDQSNTNPRPASRRPVRNTDELLDVEPIDDLSNNQSNNQPVNRKSVNEVEDPW